MNGGSNMKKVLVACDSFKGSLTSSEICEIFKERVERFGLDVVIDGVPVADGGEGTLSAVQQALGWQIVCDGDRKDIDLDFDNYYLLNGDCAFIESAKTSGFFKLIGYIDSEYDNIKCRMLDTVLHASTYGTGLQILKAINKGAKHIYLSLGGTCTNDCGFGALTALGFRFLNENGEIVPPIPLELGTIRAYTFVGDPKILKTKFTLISDVDNTLLGKNGATLFYGKQKGLADGYARVVENNMAQFADFLEDATGKSIRNINGTGGAGGLGAGIYAFFNAKFVRGIDFILDALKIDEHLVQCDAVITGEGKIDNQTFHGKLVNGIIDRAKKYSVPVYVLAGSSRLSPEELSGHGVLGMQTLLYYAESVKESMRCAKGYARFCAEELLKQIISEN